MSIVEETDGVSLSRDVSSHWLQRNFGWLLLSWNHPPNDLENKYLQLKCFHSFDEFHWLGCTSNYRVHLFLEFEPNSDMVELRENNLSFQPLVPFEIDSLYLSHEISYYTNRFDKIHRSNTYIVYNKKHTSLTLHWVWTAEYQKMNGILMTFLYFGLLGKN